jgi:hypothetical protein
MVKTSLHEAKAHLPCNLNLITMFYANSSHERWFLSGSVRAVGISTVPQTDRAGSGVGVG